MSVSSRLRGFTEQCFSGKTASYEQLQYPWIGAAAGAGLGGLAGLFGERLLGDKKKKNYLRSGLIGAGLGGAAGLARGAFMGNESLSNDVAHAQHRMKGLVDRAIDSHAGMETATRIKGLAADRLIGEEDFQKPIIDEIRRRLKGIKWNALETPPPELSLIRKEGGADIDRLRKMVANVTANASGQHGSVNFENIGLGVGLGAGAGALGGAAHAALSKDKKKRYWRDILVGAAAGGLGGGLVGSAIQPIRNMGPLRDRGDMIGVASNEAADQASAYADTTRIVESEAARLRRQHYEMIRQTSRLSELQRNLENRFLAGIDDKSPRVKVIDGSPFYTPTAEEARQSRLRKNSITN